MNDTNAFRVTIAIGSAIPKSGLTDKIVAFDKVNMAEILEAAGKPFPEEKRRSGLANGTTLIVVWQADEIAGYVDYCRNWSNANEIYISSLQVAPKYRRTQVLLMLLDPLREALAKEAFTLLIADVERTNSQAIRLYQRLGFTLVEKEESKQSLHVSAERGILLDPSMSELLKRWREKGQPQ